METIELSYSVLEVAPASTKWGKEIFTEGAVTMTGI